MLALPAIRMAPFKLPWQKSRQSPYEAEGGDDDVEAIIFANLWKNHRLLPPTSTKKRYWDSVKLLPDLSDP